MVYGDLHDRLPLIKPDILNQDEFEKYKSNIHRCMSVVADDIVVEDSRLPLELKVYEMVFKYESKTEQILRLLGKGVFRERIGYMFPFETITPGEDIYLYGGGDLGQQYLNEIEKGNYCNVLGVIDKDKEKCIVNFEPIYSVDELKFEGMEKIVISIVDGRIAKEVKKGLIKRGVKEENVIWKIYRLS